jgi:hypothetical protein
MLAITILHEIREKRKKFVNQQDIARGRGEVLV